MADVNKQIRDEFSSSPAFAELLVRKEKHWTEFEEIEPEEDLFGGVLANTVPMAKNRWGVILNGIDYSDFVVAISSNYSVLMEFSPTELEIELECVIPDRQVDNNPNILRQFQELYSSLGAFPASFADLRIGIKQEIKAQFIITSYFPDYGRDHPLRTVCLVLKTVDEPVNFCVY